MTMYPGRFNDRAAIITGGASGLGLTTARRIVAEGGTVALWDINSQALEAAEEMLGTACVALEVDVAEWTSVERAASQSVAALGNIDVLIASAGITGPNAALVDCPLADWHRVINVNLNGMFNTCRAVVPHMIKNTYGRIVTVSSIAGKEGNPNASAYSASKAGIIALTKSLGKELAKSGVLVNSLAPAVFKSPLLKQMSAQHIDYMLSKIPMGRFGEPDEVTAMICWLASAEMTFSTGAVFDISGGRATY